MALRRSSLLLSCCLFACSTDGTELASDLDDPRGGSEGDVDVTDSGVRDPSEMAPLTPYALQCPNAEDVTFLPYDGTSYSTRREGVLQRIATLESIVEDAHELGVPTHPERATLTTARRFVAFAHWDQGHPLGEAPYLSGTFSRLWWLSNIIGDDGVDAYATELASRELDETREILDAAAYRLQEACVHGHRRIAELPDPSRYEIGPEGFVVTPQEGDAPLRRVFPWGWIWGPQDEPYFGQVGSVFVQLAQGVPEVPGDFGTVRLREANRESLRQAPPGSFVFLGHGGVPQWLRNSDTADCEGTSSCVDSGAAKYTAYDIDDPRVRDAWSGLADSVAESIAQGQADGTNDGFSHVYMLANEPQWPIAKPQPPEGRACSDSGALPSDRMVSRATIAGFIEFLQGHYANIETLNARWGLSDPFESYDAIFDAIVAESATEGGEFRPPFIARDVFGDDGEVCIRGKLGSPVWEDWTDYNFRRTRAWFSHLCGAITDAYETYGVDGTPRCTIKVIGGKLGGEQIDFRPWTEPEPLLRSRPSTFDHGIDMSALVSGAFQSGEEWLPLQGVTGVDMRVESNGEESLKGHLPLPGRDPNSSGDTGYALYWKRQSMFLDFARSLAPNKMVFDSEWHGLSGAQWRDPGLTADYVRTSLWLGYTHGIGMMVSWYWSREADGAPTSRDYGGFFGSALTQPIALDAFTQTHLEVNAASPELTSLVEDRREILVWYDPIAARQDEDYGRELVHAYESVYFSGHPVGFITPAAYDQRTDEERDEIRALLVPMGEHTSNWAFERLEDFAARQATRSDPATLILLGADRSLRRTPTGGTRSPARVAALLNSDASVSIDPDRSMTTAEVHAQLDDPQGVLRGHLALEPLECRTPQENTRHTFGVLCRSAFHHGVETGGVNAPVVFVANLTEEPQRIVVRNYGTMPTTLTDVLTGEPVAIDPDAGVQLAPMEARLLRR